jgi:hypothetical protein
MKSARAAHSCGVKRRAHAGYPGFAFAPLAVGLATPRAIAPRINVGEFGAREYQLHAVIDPDQHHNDRSRSAIRRFETLFADAPRRASLCSSHRLPVSCSGLHHRDIGRSLQQPVLTRQRLPVRGVPADTEAAQGQTRRDPAGRGAPAGSADARAIVRILSARASASSMKERGEGSPQNSR